MHSCIIKAQKNPRKRLAQNYPERAEIIELHPAGLHLEAASQPSSLSLEQISHSAQAPEDEAHCAELEQQCCELTRVRRDVAEATAITKAKEEKLQALMAVLRGKLHLPLSDADVTSDSLGENLKSLQSQVSRQEMEIKTILQPTVKAVAHIFRQRIATEGALNGRIQECERSLTQYERPRP